MAAAAASTSPIVGVAWMLVGMLLVSSVVMHDHWLGGPPPQLRARGLTSARLPAAAATAGSAAASATDAKAAAAPAEAAAGAAPPPAGSPGSDPSPSRAPPPVAAAVAPARSLIAATAAIGGGGPAAAEPFPRRLSVPLGSCNGSVASEAPFIGHDVFLDACDAVFVPGKPLLVTRPSLVFLHLPHVEAFAREVVANASALPHAVVLVSNSNSAEYVPYGRSEYEEKRRPAVRAIFDSPRVAAWYGINVVERHPKIKPLPLGPKWRVSKQVHHSEEELKARVLKVLSDHASDPQANFVNYKKTQMLMSAMSDWSSDAPRWKPSKGRRRVALAQAAKVQRALPKPQPALEKFPNTSSSCVFEWPAFKHPDRLQQYIHMMRQYKFVLSPIGVSVSAHRTWEALLAGSIPVVESSAADSMYDGLPVLIVPRWEDLTLPLLEQAWERMRPENGASYHWEKLFAPWWIARMRTDLLASSYH